MVQDHDAACNGYLSSEAPECFVCAESGGELLSNICACRGRHVHRVAQRVVADVRRTRRPAFVHLSCVRLFGHAGADVESVYRSQAEIDADTSDDPLLHTARILVEHAGLSPHDVVALYRQVDDDLRARVEEAVARPKLRTAEQVMARIVPPPSSVTVPCPLSEKCSPPSGRSSTTSRKPGSWLPP